MSQILKISGHRRTSGCNARGRGFTLLEIMISVLIISIGLVSLATLQAKLSSYSATAKQRTLAVNLAEQQLETMQTIYTLASTGAGACTVAPAGFDDLASCTSGVTLTAGSLPFTMTWAVSEYVQNPDGTTSPFTVGSTWIRPDLKLVKVNVAWLDGKGLAQNAQLVDIIDATAIFNSGRVLARVESNKPPRTPFNPADFPGVVDISIGAEKLKGSTTPEPTIRNQGVNVITNFDVVTYLQSNMQAFLQRREEFKVLNCICEMNAGSGMGREPTTWNGAEYELGAEVSKRTGSVSTLESNQPAACDVCCRDHHDAVGTDTPYDPFRPAFTGDTGSFTLLGDHAHYKIVDGLKVLAGEGDDYLEVCRYVRKDGFFKLATDLSLENLDVMPEAYPVNYNAEYSTSVVDFISEFAGQLNPGVYPVTMPDATYQSLAPDIFLSNVGVTKPAMSRGIYVDYITPDLLKQVKCLQADGTGTYASYCNISLDPPWLEILPFFDVDLTALANWSKGSQAITVTNSPISDIHSSSFSRGNIGLAQTHFNVTTDVTADIELSNSGLTDTNPVDPDDEQEAANEIPVTVSIGGNPPASGVLVLGNIDAGSNQINVETVRVKQTNPAVNCEIISIVSGSSTQKAYVCDLAKSGATASGSVTFTDYNAVKVTGSSTTVLNRRVCPVGTAFDSMQVFDDGVAANPDLGIIGERTVLHFSGLTADTTVDVVIKKQTDACS